MPSPAKCSSLMRCPKLFSPILFSSAVTSSLYRSLFCNLPNKPGNLTLFLIHATFFFFSQGLPTVSKGGACEHQVFSLSTHFLRTSPLLSLSDSLSSVGESR